MNVITLISKAFKGVIWRMEIDEQERMLFIEERNVANHEVQFSSINLINGLIGFNNLQTAEPWLTGMECGFSGVLLLHHFQSDITPVHKGLTAVKADQGTTIWSNFNLSFDYLSAQGPVVYDSRIQPKKYFLLDVLTGSLLKMEPTNPIPPMRSHILSPVPLPLEQLENESLPWMAIGNLAYSIDYNNLRIVSLHALREGVLEQILVIKKGTEIIYQDLLNDNIQKIQPESFILHYNQLIYIKNKSELKVLTL